MLNKNKILMHLDQILSSKEFGESPKLKSFLAYVVNKELENEGLNTKAFTIAIDALGKGDEFDPRSDNIVRVTAGRVRTALTKFYSNAGQQSEIVITLPVGTYRPKFILRTESAVSVEVAETPKRKISRPYFRSSMMLAVIAAVVSMTFAFLWSSPSRSSLPEPDARFDAHMPIVQIELMESSGDDELDIRLDGLRHRLAEDLSRFRVVKIRMEPHDQTHESAPPIQAANFAIRGVVLGLQPTRLQITVVDLDYDTFLWSETFEFPDSWSSYNEGFTRAFRAVVLNLVGSSGAIPSALEKDLDEFLARRSDSNSPIESSFDCVLVFHAFDDSKQERLRNDARNCLASLVATGNRDAEVWAAWAMMNFLDWSRSHESELIETSLSAARKAVVLDSSYANAHEYLGSILMARGELGPARESYQTALDLNPFKPDLHVLLGWERALSGEWTSGVAKINEGMSMAVTPSAWMRIPLALDAFRIGDFGESLHQSELMIIAGDDRGGVLALAAAIALQDQPRIRRYTEFVRGNKRFLESDPLREIRSVFNDDEILNRYEMVLSEHLKGPQTDR